MNEYEFSLRFTLPEGETDLDDIVERLAENGCDDALVGVGHRGRIALEFVRESSSARQAIFSAIEDVTHAVPGASLVEVTPDLVGATDVAELVGCTRQNIQKLLASCGSTAPAPVHEGRWAVWHLAPLLDWLQRDKRYSIHPELLELSDAAMRVNAALDARNTDAETEGKIRAIFA